MELWLVSALFREVGVDVHANGLEFRQDVPLSFSTGMEGALPVFDTYQNAEAFLDTLSEECRSKAFIFKIRTTEFET